MIKRAFPVLALLLLASCSSSTTVVDERMVVSPHLVTLAAPDTATAVSITHTCTCPFSWTATLQPGVAWLQLGQEFPSTLTGDHASIALSIDRSKLILPKDSTTIHIVSNAFGIDSIQVVAIK